MVRLPRTKATKYLARGENRRDRQGVRLQLRFDTDNVELR